MHAIRLSGRSVPLVVLAAPVVVLAAYVSWLVVPVVCREVIPDVVRAVVGR